MRLCSHRHIEKVLQKGTSQLYHYPLLIKYLPTDNTVHQVLFMVGKSKHKKAVDRNLLKRRMRESYRLNFNTISQIHPLNLAIIYVSSKVETRVRINKAFKYLLQNIKETYA